MARSKGIERPFRHREGVNPNIRAARRHLGLKSREVRRNPKHGMGRGTAENNSLSNKPPHPRHRGPRIKL
jgi:hypothetical protein